MVELLGHAVGLDEPGAASERLTVPGPATLLVGQLHAELLGEPLDGLAEAEVLDLLDERDDVAALAAAEAVPGADGRADVEGRRLLVVERAQPLHRARTRGAQRDVLAHDVLDGRALLDERDVLGLDPTRQLALLVAAESRWCVRRSVGVPHSPCTRTSPTPALPTPAPLVCRRAAPRPTPPP